MTVHPQLDHQWERTESEAPGESRVQYTSTGLRMVILPGWHIGAGLGFVEVVGNDGAFVCQFTFTPDEARQFCDDLVKAGTKPTTLPGT